MERVQQMVGDQSTPPAVTPPKTNTALRAENVSIQRRGLHLITELNLAIQPGQILSLVGPSGSGKTTLLRTLAGLVPANHGQITKPPGRVGIVFQDPRLLPWLTALDNITIGLPGPRAHGRKIAAQWLDKVGLTDAANVHPAKLSGGMRQRVAIARALAIDPTVVLIDEPFSALDDTLATRLRQELTALIRPKGCITMWITHDRTEAHHVGDQILTLTGPPDGTWVITPTNPNH